MRTSDREISFLRLVVRQWNEKSTQKSGTRDTLYGVLRYVKEDRMRRR